ncbi:DNA-directed RNA polymerase III subunit RPC4 isoform X2 [Glossina fuscipes]|uniref:DNA-directed RNA polymerase III subunit RPC4 isoform X2 n=1 Tax=Glossina fuscipes TaxID=7396 RepID=A0A8U0W2S3_9MUSC|nr:DNA-directed RNA polymerase III subunit RPC4 isoform X2 [Glossina fuscipes]
MASDNIKANTEASKNSGTKVIKSSNNVVTTNATNTVQMKRELTSKPRSQLNGTNFIATKLSSLTPARDLTLGGRGSTTGARKVFLPNLNVVRNKNANVKTSKDTTARGRGRGRGSERGSLANRGGGSFIQTTGVFSEGAGAAFVRKSGNATGYARDNQESASTLRKAAFPKNESKLDLKATMAKDQDILKALDDDNNGGSSEEEDKTDLDKFPIKLNENSLNVAARLQALHVAQQAQNTQSPLSRYPQSLEELLATSETQMFLMQLPDTLPRVDEDNDVTEHDTESGSSSTDINSKTFHKSHMFKKLEEGQVGRLLRYKSGKIKLVLGESFFDLNMGMETGFLQDLMSISTNREERSGDMINLGPVQVKLTATPDWEYLLKPAPTANKL